MNVVAPIFAIVFCKLIAYKKAKQKL